MENNECSICKEIKSFIDFAMDRLHNFNLVDVGVFKICLLTLGILLGIYHHRKLKKISPLIWLTFIGAYIYLIYTVFVKPDADQQI